MKSGLISVVDYSQPELTLAISSNRKSTNRSDNSCIFIRNGIGRSDMDPGTPHLDREFDTWFALQKSTDRTRANLLADIVGHLKGAPSVKELDYTNPSLEADAIRRHLKTLLEVGVLEELEVEPGTRGFEAIRTSSTASARRRGNCSTETISSRRTRGSDSTSEFRRRVRSKRCLARVRNDRRYCTAFPI